MVCFKVCIKISCLDESNIKGCNSRELYGKEKKRKKVQFNEHTVCQNTDPEKNTKLKRKLVGLKIFCVAGEKG